MKSAIFLALFVLFTLAMTSKEASAQFNFTSAPAYNSYFKSDLFNITLTPNIQSYHASGLFNISFQIIPVYVQEITTTSIEAAAGGGAQALKTSRCPLNSHLSLDNGGCVCDFGYALDLDGNCILNVPIYIRGKLNVLSIIITGAILATIIGLYFFIFYKKKIKDKTKKEIRKLE